MPVNATRGADGAEVHEGAGVGASDLPVNGGVGFVADGVEDFEGEIGR